MKEFEKWWCDEGRHANVVRKAVAKEIWARASESSPPQPVQCFAEYSISDGTAFCLHDKGHDGPHWARNIDIDICWPMNCGAAATAPSAPPELKNASGGESPLSEDWLPAHKYGLSISHNAHKDYYAKIADHIADLSLEDAFDDAAAMERAIKTDELWVLQWYPDTPIGFYQIAASTLEELKAATICWSGGKASQDTTKEKK